MLRSFVELACHALVGPLGAESEVTRAQLDVRARSSEPHVDLATLPGKGALVAEGCEQRMGESHLGTVDLDDPCTGGSLQAVESTLPISAAGTDHRDRRLGKRRGCQQNLQDLLR